MRVTIGNWRSVQGHRERRSSLTNPATFLMASMITTLPESALKWQALARWHASLCRTRESEISGQLRSYDLADPQWQFQHEAVEHHPACGCFEYSGAAPLAAYPAMITIHHSAERKSSAIPGQAYGAGGVELIVNFREHRHDEDQHEKTRRRQNATSTTIG